MKKILLMLALTATSGAGFAQAVHQGNVIIDPYYGFPNFGKSITTTLSEGLENVEVGGYGPAGIRVGYMLADQFEIGVDAIFNGYSVTGTYDSTYYNEVTQQYDVRTIDTKGVMNRVRIQARFNYHYDVSSPNLDVYMGFGAGTNNRFYKYFENGSEVPDEDTEFTLLPVSFRFAAGTRFYFTENIGMNVELGIGGPVISGGLSVKF